jgi:hypothetical protein
MAPIGSPASHASLTLGQPAAWEDAAKRAATAGTLAARALAVLAVVALGTILMGFGLLLATVAAPLLVAVVGFAIARARRARLPLRAA